MGLKTEDLTRPYLFSKPILATAITARTPHANGDKACAEQSSYMLSASGMGKRI